MWFKKRLLQWRVKQMTQGNPVNLHAPGVELTWDLLGLLKQGQFENYKPVHGEFVELALLHSNIDELTSNLTEITRRLKGCWHIKPEQVRNKRTRGNLEQYLITKDGFMFDIEEAAYQFKEHAEGLKTALELTNRITQGQKEHNLRMLTHVFADIQTITRALLSVAYR